MEGVITASSVDVLIVGGGPVGLLCALGLASLGVRNILIIDRRSQICPWSRAIAIHTRTLELLRNFPLVLEKIKGEALALSKVNFLSDAENTIFTLNLGASKTEFPAPILLPQCRFSHIIADYLSEQYHIKVQWNSRLISYTDHRLETKGPIEATIEPTVTNAAPFKIKAKYLVGADGAHSTVRQLSNTMCDVQELPPHDYVMADCHIDWELPKNSIYTITNERGILFAGPISSELDRLIVLRSVEVHRPHPPSLEEIEALFRYVAGTAKIELKNANWTTTLKLKTVVAKTMHPSDHVFLVGDAAHSHSPLGGQGLNLGAYDAYNLAWKLAGVINGQYQPAMLLTYELEQLPYDAKAAATIHYMTAQRLKPLKPWHIWFMRSPLIQRYAGKQMRKFLTEFEINYPVGLTRSADFDSNVFTRRLLGVRAPSGVVVRKAGLITMRLHEAFEARSWMLLLFTGGRELGERMDSSQFMEAKAQVYDLSKINSLIIIKGIDRTNYFHEEEETKLYIDGLGEVHDTYGVTVPSFYLIRPDGVIACRGCLYTHIGRMYNFLRRVFSVQRT